MEKYHSELVRLMVKIACIFGIPAFGGFFAGLVLDRYFGTGRRYILITLTFCFVLSWVLLLRMYGRMRKAQKTLSSSSTDKTQSNSMPGTLRYGEPSVWQSTRKK